MEDITATVERACTCIRDLWNTYFGVGEGVSLYPAELEHLFLEHEGAKQPRLDLHGLDRLAVLPRFAAEPLPFLQVVPAAAGVPLLVDRPSADRNRYGAPVTGTSGGMPSSSVGAPACASTRASRRRG